MITKNIPLKNIIFLSLLLTCLLPLTVLAQGERRTLQLSGIVVDGAEDYGVPGVSVFIKGANKGVATNAVGFFTLPTIAGDTVVIRAVGYEQQQLVVPDKGEELGMTILVDLQSDTTLLPLVEVFPYPTKELFEEAFMALGEHRDERIENMERNLNERALYNMAMSLPMDGAANYRNFINQRANAQANKFMASPSNPLLNPFAWAEFIRSLKKKKK
ncbi:carboxypeptidase-like regulatory domain-containing protein [Limibacter armeniacum]|uniref:carboxypeptidase-like regulatory domain-containing protein n=1 Tax=Limibacter armeniacum TaxID=466084 RepID=UPI002FE5D85B